MKAKLIAHTRPTEEFLLESGVTDLNELIAYCARVSNPSNQMNHETSSKLLNYCAKQKHWSIFELVSLTLYVETTRDIARQLLRHRSFSFSEFSQRYASVDSMNETPFEVRELRFQHPTNRQSSLEWDADNEEHVELAMQWNAKQKQLIHEANMAYSWAVDKGIAKEQARVVLPEGNTMSRLYVQGTLRSFIHYCEVRTHKSTQKEHRELAEAIAGEVARVFPYITKNKNKEEN